MLTQAIEFEVKCIGCGELMKPADTEWDMFRIGIHVHNKQDCCEKAYERLYGKTWDLAQQFDCE